jgi:hypothetical protein
MTTPTAPVTAETTAVSEAFVLLSIHAAIEIAEDHNRAILAENLRDSAAYVAAVYAERDALHARLKEVSDICREVYQKTPMLPVDESTMEAATDALHAFCLMLGIVGIDISDEALARSKGGAS